MHKKALDRISYYTTNPQHSFDIMWFETLDHKHVGRVGCLLIPGLTRPYTSPAHLKVRFSQFRMSDDLCPKNMQFSNPITHHISARIKI